MVDALLQQTNLWSVASKKALKHLLRRRMKQRFRHRPGPARNPRLIIVDEPTAGLDPPNAIRFLNLLSSNRPRRHRLSSPPHRDDVANFARRNGHQSAPESFSSKAHRPDALRRSPAKKFGAKLSPSDDELRAMESHDALVSTHLIGGKPRSCGLRRLQPGTGFQTPADSIFEDVLISAEPLPQSTSSHQPRPPDMTMFWNFFTFELKFRFKSISTYIYFFAGYGPSIFLNVASESFGPHSATPTRQNSPQRPLRQRRLTTPAFPLFGLLSSLAIFGNVDPARLQA